MLCCCWGKENVGFHLDYLLISIVCWESRLWEGGRHVAGRAFYLGPTGHARSAALCSIRLHRDRQSKLLFRARCASLGLCFSAYHVQPPPLALNVNTVPCSYECGRLQYLHTFDTTVVILMLLFSRYLNTLVSVHWSPDSPNVCCHQYGRGTRHPV